MATPVERIPMLADLLEKMSVREFGRSRRDSIIADICVRCGESATEFDGPLSTKEYTMTGFCQICQDFIFSEEGIDAS